MKEKIYDLIKEAIKESKEEFISEVKKITTDVCFTLCKTNDSECIILAETNKLSVIEKADSGCFNLDDVASMESFLYSVVCCWGELWLQ